MTKSLIEQGEKLLTKDELAQRLNLKRRGVESLVERRRIPVIRLSHRCVRFRWEDVMRVLRKATIPEE